MGGLNLKICRNFVGQKIFIHLCWDISLYGELKLYGGATFITTLSLFHFFRNSHHPEKWSVSLKNFFRKCEYIRSCYLLIFSNSLKKSFRKNSLFSYCDRCFGEKCFVSYIFQTIILIAVIKILEKYWWRSSVLEKSF